jgi:serine/threonine protein kinase
MKMIDLTDRLNDMGTVDSKDKDPIYGILNDVLPHGEGSYNKYSGIDFFTEGGTRRIYTASWGPGNKKVVIKVDKTPKSAHAKRHVSRGYTTERELQIVTNIKDAEGNNIIPIRDYYFSPELKGMGYSGFVTVEDFFPGQTLKELVTQHGPLGKQDFVEAFGDVVQAEKYLINTEGILHRDPNTSNILIKKNGRTRASLIDLTNAARIDDLKDGVLPTSGSRYLVDPSKIQGFTGQISHYDESSEARALVTDMYYAVTGEMPFRFDIDGGEATNMSNGENLLDENGRIDQKKYQKGLESAISKIPKTFKRFRKLFKKGLSLDSQKKYESINDLASDFEKASKPTVMEELRSFSSRHQTLMPALAMAGIIGAMSLGGYTLDLYSRASRAEVRAEMEGKQHVNGEFRGRPAEVDANIIDVKPQVINKGDNSFPERTYVKVKPGDTLNIYVNSQSKSFKKVGRDKLGAPNLRSKAYIEGYEGNYFTIYSKPFDETVMYEDQHGGYYNWPDIEVPKGISEGNHTLVIETYSGKNRTWPIVDGNSTYDSGEKYFHYDEEGAIIDRKRVPLVVGNPKEKVDISFLKLDWMRNMVNLKDLGEGESATYYFTPKEARTVFTIPELDTTWIGENSFPKCKDTSKLYTLQVEYKDKNDSSLGYTFFPIKSENVWGETYSWKHAYPDSTWSNTLVAYREAIEGDSTKVKGMRAEEKRILDENKLIDSVVNARSKEISSSGGQWGLGYFNFGQRQKIIDSIKAANRSKVN